MRNKIRKSFGELDKLFSRDAKEKNVKVGIQDTIEQFSHPHPAAQG